MNRKVWLAPVAAVVSFGFAGLAAAQQQEGLVNVTVTDIEIIKDVNANVNLPVTVQVPIGVAANVCGVNANVIAEQRQENPDYTCTAKNASRALSRAVQEEVSQE